MKWHQITAAALRKAYYLFQRTTGYGIDDALEQDLERQAATYLAGLPATPTLFERIERVRLCDLDLSNRSRFSVVRDDIYVRFQVDERGTETDQFGRTGTWIPRGCLVHFDRDEQVYVKTFDAYFCRQGEGHFLPVALRRGLYDFLCPALSYLVVDRDETIRGYAIRAGQPLTPYEFERYVGGSLRELICRLTALTGLYLNDLVYHNVILVDGRLSLIDLESVLPVEWFGQGIEFARQHLDEIDLGWPIQTKWHSPRWYRAFLTELTQ
jgi:hypothetical protein